jgi:hypothetical protein
MGLTEIQKQTIAQRSIRAIAAEVGVDKGTVLLAKQKIKPMHLLLKKRCLHNSIFLFLDLLFCLGTYEFFFLASDSLLNFI